MAGAQEAEAPGRFGIELNNASETEGGNCRLTYVAENHSGHALDQTEYQVAVFDAEGIVSRLLVLKFGKLIDGKTRILQFELPGTPCSGISRIVINDNSACIDAETGKETDICMSALDATSRTDIRFGI
ncbi:hypothetical protein J5474_21125 [Sagittula sp. M10.9X]|uniref:Uncharacterized protein n=1 Tax=Sagittula salina TaxID=2820268 RepID=A0A940S5B7_9RHOB|nr:hypothetical protein [Sagittula salina]